MKFKSIILSISLAIGTLVPSVHASQAFLVSMRACLARSCQSFKKFAITNPKLFVGSATVTAATTAYTHHLHKKCNQQKERINYLKAYLDDKQKEIEAKNELLKPIHVAFEEQEKQPFQALVSIFNQMQKRLGISPIIPLHERCMKYTRGCDAQYDFDKKCIDIDSEFLYLPPSVQIRTLLHELRHHMQLTENFESVQDDHSSNMRLTDEKRKKIEHDADLFATKQITCLPCLLAHKKQALEYQEKATSSESKQPRELGYFGPEDYEPFIAQAKMKKQWCKAHTQNDGHELPSPSDQSNKFQNFIQEMAANYKLEHPTLRDCLPTKML